MRVNGFPLAIATALVASALATQPAAADCAEDLTRIQTGAATASADVRAIVEGLVTTAQNRIKALDSDGCRAATGEALKLLGLTSLPRLTLSTPVPGLDRNPQPPAPSPDQASAAPPSAAPDKQASADQDKRPSDASGRAAPAAPASTATQSAPAIPATPQTTAQGTITTQDWYVLTSDFIGKPVTSQDNPGDSIGVIRGVAIDGPTQQAVLVLIETGGFLGIGSDLIAVPYSALMFNERWERPAIRANTEVIQSGPRVTAGKVDALLTDPQWRKLVSEHFGMPLVPASAPPVHTQPGTAPPAAAPRAQRPAAPVAAAPPAGDSAKGHAYVKMVCAGCHTFDANGGTRVGPNLHNVLGRQVAGVSGFSYSQGLKRHGGVWDAAALNTFLQSPQHFATGTVMAFPGIPSGDDRANVIAYLKAIGSTQGAQK